MTLPKARWPRLVAKARLTERYRRQTGGLYGGKPIPRPRALRALLASRTVYTFNTIISTGPQREGLPRSPQRRARQQPPARPGAPQVVRGNQ